MPFEPPIHQTLIKILPKRHNLINPKDPVIPGSAIQHPKIRPDNSRPDDLILVATFLVQFALDLPNDGHLHPLPKEDSL